MSRTIMPGRQLSLHVVGASHPNRKGGVNRRFEILLCPPGEPVALVPEPQNPVDPFAIAVFSARGVQIGYLTAERAPWVGSMMRNGKDIAAIFQQATATGAIVRVGIDDVPVLPPIRPQSPEPQHDEEFWPDYIPPDD
jgi:hypothetical protein